MSNALSDLKGLRNKKPQLPKTGFISKLGDSKKQPTTTDVKPEDKPHAKQADHDAPHRSQEALQRQAPTQIPVSDVKGIKQKVNLDVAFKVPKSSHERFQALVDGSSLPAKRVLQAISKKFIPHFRKQTALFQPSQVHTESFSDNVPHLYHRTRIVAEIGDIDHIDQLGLLEPKKVYENWVQWEFISFLEKYLDEFESK